MPAPALYLHLPGTAAEALSFYQKVFGGEIEQHTFAQFERTDGPGSAIAHGVLSGVVDLFLSDAGEADEPFSARGLMVALLGEQPPSVLREWFGRLAEGGEIVDALQKRPWGDFDGQVRDRYGVLWLIGFANAAEVAETAGTETASTSAD